MCCFIFRSRLCFSFFFSDKHSYLSSPTVWPHWIWEPRGWGGRGFASAVKTSQWLSKLFSSPTEPSWFQTEIPQHKYNLIFSCSISLESDWLQSLLAIKKMNMITSANNTKSVIEDTVVDLKTSLVCFTTDLKNDPETKRTIMGATGPPVLKKNPLLIIIYDIVSWTT